MGQALQGDDISRLMFRTAVSLGTENRKTENRTEITGTETEITETEKIGSRSVPGSEEPNLAG